MAESIVGERQVDPKSTTHCRQCGRPFTEVPRYYSRLVCWDCGLEYQRQKSRIMRLLYTAGVYARGKRYSETHELNKITGRARLLRDRRIARYRRCVERGVPIEYEPRDEL
jgi:hypothetical protein